jgi:hypothetical protein
VSLAQGDAFFTPEAGSVLRHLWVVVSDPAPNPHRVVIANFSTLPSPKPDPPEVRAACDGGEHPSLGHESFIRCDLARVASVEDLERLLRARQLAATKPAPAPLIQKVRLALLASKNTILEVKEILRASP